MANEQKKQSAKIKQLGSYSVNQSDKPDRKTVSFTVPTLPRPQLSRPQPGQRRGLLTAILFILATVLAGFSGAWLEGRSNQIDQTDLATQRKIVSSESQLISQIAREVGPSVVSVNVAITSGATTSNDPFGVFGFSQQQPQQQQAAGTGIIISDKGVIVTNRHVVPEGTTNVSVTLSDGTELKDVSVLGRTNGSDSLDIAFLKVNDLKGHKLKAAALGNSSAVQVGDNVVAIGNALGQFQNTVTSGIISGYGRSVEAGDSSGNSSDSESLDDLFQTDAAINEGNSGGPLVNLNGQVIGINTAVAGNAQNIGFAIPINDVRGLVDQVLKTGKFSRPYLGVRYVPLSADIASEFDLKVTQGAFIVPSTGQNSSSVISDGPAAKAGLKESDVITAVADTKVDQAHSLTSLLGTHQPGDKVKLTIRRGDHTLHLTVTLGSLPSTDQPG